MGSFVCNVGAVQYFFLYVCLWSAKLLSAYEQDGHEGKVALIHIKTLLWIPERYSNFKIIIDTTASSESLFVARSITSHVHPNFSSLYKHHSSLSRAPYQRSTIAIKFKLNSFVERKLTKLIGKR